MERIKDYLKFINEKEGRSEAIKNTAMCEMSSTSFKEIFSTKINESNGYITEEIIEKAHSVYELEKFYENRKSWFKEGTEEIISLDCDEYVLLFKNNQVYILESKTYYADESIFNINESVWSWFTNTSKKIVSGIGSGLTRVYKFVRNCTSALVKFDHNWEDVISTAIPVLSGIILVIGWATGSFTICNFIAGGLLMLGGVRHCIHGGTKIGQAVQYCQGKMTPPVHLTLGEDATEEDKKKQETQEKNIAWKKVASDVFTGLSKTIAGIASLIFGFFDILLGWDTASSGNPTNIVSKDVPKQKAHKYAKDWCMGIPSKMEHFLIDLYKHIGQAPGAYTGLGDLTKEGGQMLAMGTLSIVQIFIVPVCEKIFGAVFTTFLKGLKTSADIIAWLTSYPEKLKKSCEEFCENPKGLIMKLVAKGVNKLIIPLLKFFTEITNKITETMKGLSEWSERQLKAYKAYKEFKEWKKDSALNQSVRELQTVDINTGEKIVDKDEEGVQLTDDQKAEIQRLADIADRADKRIESTGKKKSHDDKEYREMANKLQEAGKGMGNVYKDLLDGLNSFLKNEADWIELFISYGIRDGRNLIRNLVYETGGVLGREKVGQSSKFVTGLKNHLKEIGCKDIDKEWEYFGKKENKSDLEMMSEEDKKKQKKDAHHESTYYSQQISTSKLIKFDKFKY